MEIKNIIFDFGGVLIDWNPMYLYENVFSNNEELKYFLNEICNAEWNQKQDEGRPFKNGVEELTKKFPDYKNEIEMYHSHWIDMIGGEIHENTSLIYNLKTNYRLFGLTNWSFETLPLVYNRYSFFKELEGVVVSGVEKMLKPNPEIYKLLLDRYTLDPEQSLFIDDNEDNIKSASDLGFQVIHFHDGKELKSELEHKGVKLQTAMCFK